MPRTSKALAILRDRETAASAAFDSASRELNLVRILLKALENSDAKGKKKGKAPQPDLPGVEA
jgi:hypothetical protein